MHGSGISIANISLMNAILAVQQIFVQDVLPHLILATMAFGLFAVLISAIFTFLLLERWFSRHRTIFTLWRLRLYTAPKFFCDHPILMFHKVTHWKTAVTKANSFVSHRHV